MPQRKLLYITTSGVGLLLIGVTMVSLKLYDFSVKNKRLKDKITLEKSIHQNQISEILKRYDSLNEVYASKQEVLDQQKKTSDSVTTERNLTPIKKTVSTAKKLKAINVNARGVRIIGKDVVETTVSSKIDQVRIRFTLEENKDLESGNKKIFIQVANPKNRLLILKGHSETQLVKEIYYDRLNTDACLFVDLYQHQLIMGDYKINLVCEGTVIGSANFRVN
nr:hypothetical protein [uncultured Flavobacterium sp.]